MRAECATRDLTSSAADLPLLPTFMIRVGLNSAGSNFCTEAMLFEFIYRRDDKLSHPLNPLTGILSAPLSPHCLACGLIFRREA